MFESEVVRAMLSGAYACTVADVVVYGVGYLFFVAPIVHTF